MWTECNIGGGEEIEGYEDGGPPTLCQPASQQGGGEEVKYPGRRSLEGVGGVLGFWVNFWESESFHLKGSNFNHLCAVDWPAC